ncbi:hydrolase [Bacillus atrophaeus]|uniref:hydrolase n=1 Tax=Bacillus atrophaeus TaxID=1452 RepID=UPI00227EE622|nr:hydrolase [Bacillus atrophaeus]MCY8973081.1 hydrolase [Bacillus atrophaeus]
MTFEEVYNKWFQQCPQLFMENLKKDLRLEIIKLSSSLGRDSDDQSHPINDEHTKRMIGNLKYFITYEIPGICSRTFDLDVLKSSSVQVLPAGGSTSQDFFPYHCARALGEQLETEIVKFPRHHNGYRIHPKEFADRLHDVLVNY